MVDEKLKTVLATYKVVKAVDIDSILNSLSVTHLKFRGYCHKHEVELPWLTVGLALELATVKATARELQRMYKLTPGEVHTCLYRKNYIKPPPAFTEVLREQGKSEACIKYLTGSHLTISAKAEINELLNLGLTGTQVASMFGITESRVSQVKINKRHRNTPPKLTKQEKRLIGELKNSGVPAAELAERYNTTTNTVYKYAREL